ncbi:unnamed protein product [Rotaria magnacalcarata]|uniref:DRBM domain-containing protein n=1 Tax=Rotaria magnacalcarata TaxID=392030 RepID=A0A8S2NS84_9BILA|nr:unnamed protein product [Rotaria magnacalcarata]
MNFPESLLSSLFIKSDTHESSIPHLLPTQTAANSNVGSIHDKPITDLALKTPISFLQEICFRIHATPTYSLCPSEAQCTSNEPAFLYRVVVDDMIAFGKGSSKKRAKHKAAWCMVEQCYAKLQLVASPLVKTIEEYFTIKPLQTCSTSEDTTNTGEKSNPIGKLQELTQKNWIRPPEYEFFDQENTSVPNSKTYSCLAKVAAYTAEGSGLSKKIAKRLAATNLLNILENLGPDEKKALLNRTEEQASSTLISDAIEFLLLIHRMSWNIHSHIRNFDDHDLLDTSGTRGAGVATRSNRLYDKNSFHTMKNSDLPNIKKLLSDNHSPELSQSYELFQCLAQEQNFAYEFIQLPTNSEGSIELLLEVRLMPVSVFHGCGETFDIARQQATNFALKYIRSLSKQYQQQQNSLSQSATTTSTQSIA